MKRKLQPNLAQKQALVKLNNSFNSGKKKCLVVLPSGLGKTVYSSLAIKKEKGNILYLAHKKEILEQAMNEFERTGNKRENFGIIHGKQKQINKRYTFAMVQSLSKEKTIKGFNKNHFNFIILDEWHHVGAATYDKVLKYFNGYKLLGLTATPYRLDGKDVLKPVNNNLIYKMNIAEGIQRGFLSPFNYIGLFDDVDYSKIKWHGKSYSKKDLNKTLLIDKRDKKIIEEFNKRLKNKQTLGFCVSIEHVERCVKKFSNAGIKCGGIVHDTSEKNRKKLMDDFRNKKIQVLFTVNIFNEGVDFPSVEGLLFLRPTISKTIFLQQLGRGLRKYPGKKEVMVLDFIGNYVNAFKVRTWIKEITPKGGSVSKKIIYNYRLPKVSFEAEVIKIFETQIERNVTKDKLIKEYYRVEKLLKRKPFAVDFKKKSIHNVKYSIGTYVAYFGSWNNFTKEIGEPSSSERRVLYPSKETLLKSYNKLKKNLGGYQG